MVRHDAALALFTRGDLDPVLALSLVLWPRKGSRLEDEQVPPGKQLYSDDLREEIRRRHAEGETLPELALKTGIPYAQIKFICSAAGAAGMTQRVSLCPSDVDSGQAETASIR